MATLLWTQRQDMGASARVGHALVYDAGNKRTLLVAGDGPSVFFHDSWLWNGETWTQVEDIGPSGRTGHALAYDSARSRVVLFGGLGASGQLADTWEWDGEAWTQVEDTGPSARARHALAYDSTRSRVVLFGGEGAGGLLGDTWEWDGDEWTQVADTGPSPRRGHAMCFEASAQRSVLFGGSNGSDTWAWNGTGWTELNDVGPPPCEGTALVFTGQSTLLFGGLGPEASAPLFGATWELVGGDWTERQDMGPTPRFGHAMAYDSTRGRVVLFGGSGASPTTPASLFADTWELPAGGGQTQPGPVVVHQLASLTILPNPVPQGTSVSIEVRLYGPLSHTIQVPIYLRSYDLLAVPHNSVDTGLRITVPAGAVTGSAPWLAPNRAGQYKLLAYGPGHETPYEHFDVT